MVFLLLNAQVKEKVEQALAADYSGSLYGKYRACWIATKDGERLSGIEKCLEQDIHSFKRQGGVDEIVIGPITRQPTAMRFSDCVSLNRSLAVLTSFGYC